MTYKVMSLLENTLHEFHEHQLEELHQKMVARKFLYNVRNLVQKKHSLRARRHWKAGVKLGMSFLILYSMFCFYECAYACMFFFNFALT